MQILISENLPIDRLQALQAAATDWLAKPCGAADLVSKVEAIARQRTAAATPRGVGLPGFGDAAD